VPLQIKTKMWINFVYIRENKEEAQDQQHSAQIW
jgi:hypothetical protein